MPFDFDTLQKFINSPPGQLAAGAVLAGIVWNFFEKVEAVLNDDNKLEIAVWLVGVKTASERAGQAGYSKTMRDPHTKMGN